MAEKQPKYLNIQNFAVYLNVSSEIIEEWIDKSILSRSCYFKVSGITRINLSEALRELHEFSSRKVIPEQKVQTFKNVIQSKESEQQKKIIREDKPAEKRMDIRSDIKTQKNKTDIRRINSSLYKLAHDEENFTEYDDLDFNEGLDFEDTSIYQVAEAVGEYEFERDYTDRPVKVGDTVFVLFYDECGERFGDKNKLTLVKDSNVKKGQISTNSAFGKKLLNAIPFEVYSFEEEEKIRRFIFYHY